jgi:preprotein translocase subunit SecA
MATGEGKSTIVCILAIFKALEVKGDFSSIDIITSSPVLAERDAKHKENLFKMFGLTCNHNADAATPYIYGPKQCYRANIVYGEVSQFQFDRLRDEYSCLGTLAGRNNRRLVAIVDEVDSMLIDDSSKIARLSSSAAGMDHFQPVYCYLWNRLIYIKEKFIVFEDKMYLVHGKVMCDMCKILE